MKANLRVLVPEGTTNYISNPAVRYVTTGWTAFGSSISRVLTKARFGIASLKVVTNGSALNEGVFYRANNLTGISEPLTASIYARGGSGNESVRIRLIQNPDGNEWYSQPVALRADRWTRLEVSGYLAATAAGNDVRLYVETTGMKAVTFYVDGAQLERKAYSTTYCDGDQPGCRWNLEAHNSLSSRDAYTRDGGKWVALAGPCRYNDNLYVTVLGGMGMPPIENRTQSWAQAPGSFFQNIKVRDRVVTFSFFAKNKKLGFQKGADLSPLHELRQQLTDLIKPDKTGGDQAFLFEYDSGDRPLYIRLRYEAGLEGEWDVRNGWVNAFPVRFLAVDPFFTEDSHEDAELNFTETIPILSGRQPDSVGRINGAWGGMSPGAGWLGLESAVLCMAVGPKGEIYAGGNFTAFSLNRIAKWDGNTWVSLGGANSSVNAIAVAPNGDLYATGGFSIIGGVAASRIAKYTAATGTWSALSTGLANTGRALAISANGNVYVGGDFTTAGGVTVNRITYWDGLQFRVVGTPAGTNGIVRALKVSKDGGTVYMGGDFTANSAGVVDYRYIASIDTSTNLITSLGTSYLDNSVYSLAVGPDGTLYVGGTFTTYASGTLDVLRVARFSGQSFFQLGDGVASGTVYTLSFGPDGILYMGGDFMLSGSLPVPRLAKWVNDVIYPVDFFPAKSSALAVQVLSMIAHPNGDLYLGMSGIATASFGSARTNVNNSGTMEVKPIVYIQGAGVLRYIENQNTKKKIHFNLTLFAGEEVFIDFAKGTITSLWRGDVSYGLVNPTDIGDFSLIPGNNVIAAFMTDDVGGSMKISYVPQHWSADAVVDAEALQ